RSWQWATAAALILIVCASVVVYRRTRPLPVPSELETLPPVLSESKTPPPSCMAWPVTSLAGEPSIDGCRINNTGCLDAGELLETDAASRVNIDIPQIGAVEIAPNSRVKLITTNNSEHRMALEHGKLHAK